MAVIDQFKLQGKVALVTGAGRNLGKAIAFALSEAGADVALTSRSLPEIEKTGRGNQGAGAESPGGRDGCHRSFRRFKRRFSG